MSAVTAIALRRLCGKYEPATPGTDATVVAAGGSPPRDWALPTAVGACVAVTVGSFFFVQPLIDVADSAADALPF